jgi:exodeoxyribonuclease VII small subunit
MTRMEMSVEKMSYEKALTELDEVIRQLEDQTLALDVTLQLFERGKALLNRCQSLLDEAELKVREISAAESNSDDAR